RKVKKNEQLLLTENDDLLISRVGSVGVCSVIEEYQEGLALSDNVIAVKFKENTIPTRYIAAYLNSSTGKLQIDRIIKGAVQSVINYQSIKKLKIPILDIETMNKIDLLIKKWKKDLLSANHLIKDATQDVESLIEGTFDRAKVN